MYFKINIKFISKISWALKPISPKLLVAERTLNKKQGNPQLVQTPEWHLMDGNEF